MIKESELILNSDGTVFHLHLKPENVDEIIILVGDPSRVNTVSEFFENVMDVISTDRFDSASANPVL